jgi:TrpR family transcriptional regulator, trp operon repressor
MRMTEGTTSDDPHWQHFVRLLIQSIQDDRFEQFFQLIFTPDERESLATRTQIIEALLRGELSQRQLKEQLGVGIATITRGSNELKSAPTSFVAWLRQQLAINPTDG